ncbi:coiled-coil protein [Legionella beliardensis]|uniref:Coiled-coil protein n=2 Tax=Legionella beliardensis TaxID=91822 RepID=A0A378I3J8_9GAMM|nr:coiled-coil protein [Legionella beliardensis]
MKVPLQVRPLNHGVESTCIGSIHGAQAGAVIFGYYHMDYCLPGGDYLRIIANHNKSASQILLFTSDPEKLKQLPGKRVSSLVAECIRQINGYLIRSDSYTNPRYKHQEKKYYYARLCLQGLSDLLEEERKLASHDWTGQEKLRTKVISLIEQCRDKNRLLANSSVVSEGYLGNILYHTKQTAQYYQFNRVFPVSRIDQLDFTDASQSAAERQACFVWDSDIHVEQDEKELDDTLRVLCKLYNLKAAPSLNKTPANRFERLAAFFYDFYENSKYLANHLAKEKLITEKHIKIRSDGLTLTTIKPYYQFVGPIQQGQSSLQALIAHFTHLNHPGLLANSKQHAYDLLTTQANGSWADLPHENRAIIRVKNNMIALHYFEQDGLFYPLPSGEDLVTLSHLTKKHLFLPEKINLQVKAFFSRIPLFFKHSLHSLHYFFTQDLYYDFVNHIHKDHQKAKQIKQETKPILDKPAFFKSIVEIMIGHGLLKNGQSLDAFIQEHITKSKHIIVKEEHMPNAIFYTNPLHRLLSVVRHLGMFFVDKSEENPLIGTLALLAYIYGGGAIVAPEVLKAVLNKLYLNGLIAGIEPTQKLGQWMSHGTMSEAISAAVTYWQGIIVAGDLDHFFINAVNVLRDKPAEVAIIITLAMGLGYSMCKLIPALQKEMGPRPEINYLALGAKGGAAIYDTIMHPGNDWLLGTIKWLFRGLSTLGKIVLGPAIEAYYYGYKAGFLNGLKKSKNLAMLFLKQIGAATLDFLLALATVPFLEMGALLIHVPFRGITNFASRLLGGLGKLKPIGDHFINFAKRPGNLNYLTGFRLLPLYGYTNPIGHYHPNKFINFIMNGFLLLTYPIFQTIKNFLILPLIELLSFSTRLLLTILNPLSRLLAYTLGLAILATAFIWDDSVGGVFRLAAKGITYSSNWLDKQAGHVKQFCLAKIQICRQYLYHMTFAAEDAKLYHINEDKNYYLEKPIRLDKLEKTFTANNPRFLTLLLNTISTDSPANTDLPKQKEYHYSPLFTELKQPKQQGFALTNSDLTM